QIPLVAVVAVGRAGARGAGGTGQLPSGPAVAAAGGGGGGGPTGAGGRGGGTPKVGGGGGGGGLSGPPAGAAGAPAPWRGGWHGFLLDDRRRRCWTRRRGRRSLLSMDEFQHIARLGDMGKIDLGLDSILGGRRPRGLGGTLRLGNSGLEMSPHFFSFVVFERTGMGLLFRDANQRQHVQYGFALN